VRIATENILADFLREIREVSIVRKRYEEQSKYGRESDSPETMRRADYDREKLLEVALSPSEGAVFLTDNEADLTPEEESTYRDDHVSDKDYRDSGGESFSSGLAEPFAEPRQFGNLVKESE
jgi:vacuole morphology and inheritance protein 14